MLWITGGSGGIGTALSEIAISHKQSVTIFDNEPPALAGVNWESCDFRDLPSVKPALTRALNNAGPARVLVNLAGIYRVRSLQDFNWDELDEYMGVNLRGPLAVSLEWERATCELENRCLINVSSAGALRGSRDLAYAASKAALLGATRSLARSFAERKVTVIGVTPGIIDSPMSRQMSKTRQLSTIDSTIAERAGTDKELADFLFYLATGQTSYLTGTIIPFDGGLS